jgi:hypothetical protein
MHETSHWSICDVVLSEPGLWANDGSTSPRRIDEAAGFGPVEVEHLPSFGRDLVG